MILANRNCHHLALKFTHSGPDAPSPDNSLLGIGDKPLRRLAELQQTNESSLSWMNLRIFWLLINQRGQRCSMHGTVY